MFIRLALTSCVLLLAATSNVAVAKKTLFERLGKKPAIKAVVDQFVTNCATDDRINSFFKVTAADPKRLNKFKNNLVEQICQATGGPCKYTGKDMRTAHKGMGITEEHFNALVEDLTKALDKFNVGETEKNELVGALAGMKADIVSTETAENTTDESTEVAQTTDVAERTEAAEATKTLYERLGKTEAIKAVVDEFVTNCATDDRIKSFFTVTAKDPKRLAKFKTHLVNQICQATGGPCKYTGKNMRVAHKGLRITEDDFTALVEDLKKALDKFNVGETEQNELIGALAKMKNDIVSTTTATAHTTEESAGGANSLYVRLGKMPAIKAVVDKFVANCATDAKIKGFFAKTASNPKRLAHFKNTLIEQICVASGGPCTYKGKDMKTAHRGMQITDEHFNALMADLKAALDHFKVGSTEQDDLINALGTMRGEIVGHAGE